MSKYKIIITIVAIIVIVFLLWIVKDKETIEIKLYYYNPSLDQGPGGPQCTERGLVEVKRKIPRTENILLDSITLLLAGPSENEVKTKGIYTEFPLAGVTLKSAKIENNTAMLEISDPQGKIGGGSCRVSILRAEIEATAKQFSHINNVKFVPEDPFQP